jgi:hypothetical protein
VPEDAANVFGSHVGGLVPRSSLRVDARVARVPELAYSRIS